MANPNFVEQYEKFRSSMVAGINNLDIDEAQKQIFIIALQSFYLQMLRQIPSNVPTLGSEIIYPDVMN
jgi:hypothetical protein